MKESVIRSISGIVYIVLLVGATLFSEESFQFLFALFMCLAAFEFGRLYKIPSIPVLICIITALCAGWWINRNPSYSFFYLLTIPFLIYLAADLFQNDLRIRQAMGWKLAHLTGYVLLPFLVIIRIPFIQNTYQPHSIIGIFILIWTNDTFAYICGKWLGRHKLYEKISPKKTIEGFVGGVIFSLIASIVLARYYVFFSLTLWMVTAVITSFMGTIGDLVESKYKRQAQVKDSGNIMPGHGGVLDRLDSIIFAAPFLYLMYQIL